MKSIKVALIFFVLNGTACGKSRVSSEMILCHGIASEVKMEFLDQGREAPSSWAELKSNRMIREGNLEMGVKGLRIYNKFALVPGAPEIQKAPKIPREYSGIRLFLIQRATEPKGIHSYPGRAAILIGPETGNPKGRIVKGVFLEEQAAQAMIAQIQGFDPKRQPLAFEDEFIAGVEERKQDMRRELAEAALPERDTNTEKSPEADSRKTKEWTAEVSKEGPASFLFVAILALAAVCLVWLACKKYRSHSKNK